MTARVRRPALVLVFAVVLGCSGATSRMGTHTPASAAAGEPSRASAAGALQPSRGPSAAETVCRFPLAADRESSAGWPVLGGGPSGPWLVSVRVLGRVSGEIVLARRDDAPAMWARVQRGESRVEGWIRPDSLRLSPTRAIALSDTGYLVGNARLVFTAVEGEAVGIAVPPPDTLRGGELRATVPCAWLTADDHPVLSVDLDVTRPSSERVLRRGVPIEFRATADAKPSSTLAFTDLAVAGILQPGAKRTRVVYRDHVAGLAFVGWVDNEALGEPFVGGLGLLGTGREVDGDFPHHAACAQPVDLVAELDGRRWQLGRLGAAERLQADAPDVTLASIRTDWLRPTEGARLRLAAQRDAGCRP